MAPERTLMAPLKGGLARRSRDWGFRLMAPHRGANPSESPPCGDPPPLAGEAFMAPLKGGLPNAVRLGGSVTVPTVPHLGERHPLSPPWRPCPGSAVTAPLRGANPSESPPCGDPRSCCGARRRRRPAKRTCLLPTAATRSPPFLRHRRRSGRSPLAGEA